MRMGLISDTHGLLRPEAVKSLTGVEQILHLGDVGDPAILRSLEKLAPVTAIRGNIDDSGECARLPERLTLTFEGRRIHLVHNIAHLRAKDLDGVDAVLYGHSHKPLVEERKGVLYFNPGSAGPRRFRLPITLGFLTVDETGIRAEIVSLVP